MPVVPEGQMRPARPHDQIDRGARDRALWEQRMIDGVTPDAAF